MPNQIPPGDTLTIVGPGGGGAETLADCVLSGTFTGIRPDEAAIRVMNCYGNSALEKVYDLLDE